MDDWKQQLTAQGHQMDKDLKSDSRVWLWILTLHHFSGRMSLGGPAGPRRSESSSRCKAATAGLRSTLFCPHLETCRYSFASPRYWNNAEPVGEPCWGGTLTSLSIKNHTHHERHNVWRILLWDWNWWVVESSFIGYFIITNRFDPFSDHFQVFIFIEV